MSEAPDQDYFSPPELKDGLKPEEEDEVARLVQTGQFTNETARQRVLRDRYIPTSSPPDVDIQERPRKITIDRRKLGAEGKRVADDDKTAETFRANTEGGGAILDMDPDKRAQDLKQLREISERLGNQPPSKSS